MDFYHSAGKDVITRLLDKREWTRLGSKSGASEVKQHKWFAKINWGLLRNTQPPVSFPSSHDEATMCLLGAYVSLLQKMRAEVRVSNYMLRGVELAGLQKSG